MATRVYWLAFFCFFLALLRAQTPVFEKITIENGLSQGMVFDICQTRDGFLWVATKDGLNRYDGYNFKVFTNNPFDSLSIAGNTVTALFEDSRGWLWLGIKGKGVDVYDSKTGHFRHFSFNFDENKSPWGGSIESILETPHDGSVFAISHGGAILHFTMPATWPKGLPDPKILPPQTVIYPPPPKTSLFPDRFEVFIHLQLRPNGDVLVFSQKMAYCLDAKTLEITQLEQWTREKLRLSSIRVEHEGEEVIWHVCVDVKSNEEYSELLRLRNGQISTFAIPRHTNSLWKRFSRGKDNHVWFSMGPNIWDLAPDETPDFTKPDFTFDYFANRFTTDRTGNLWAATAGYGLRKINPLKGHFHAAAAGFSLGGVWAQGDRYFARYLNEIRVFDPQTGKLADSTAFPDAPAWQSSLAFEPSGGLWLLCATREDVSKPTLLHYPPDGGAADQKLILESVLSHRDPMFRAFDGCLWLASSDGRLLRFDPNKTSGQAAEAIDFFKFGHLFGENAKNITSIAIAGETNGRIWVGTQTGLVKATPKAQIFDFQLIKADTQNPGGLNNNSIACILPTADGQIWLGTKGGGINILNPETGLCRHITTADGLLNDVVYGILPGSRADEFWCSTNRGLAKIVVRKKEPFEFEITTFTAAVGLQDNEFNTQAFWKSDRGELLFGGINGLNHFFPEKLRSDTTPPPVFIVGLEINRKKTNVGDLGSPLTAPLEMTRRIELTFEQNNLSFEFAALDFTDPSKNRYRYRLVGLENDWVEAGSSRFAHYSHLPPGHYELRVQGSNGESAWRDAMPVVIVVNPPWYRSNLAYLCYCALLVWAGWRAYQFQIRRVKEREQLAFEHRETERVKVLEQLKTNFFSNVTHEFRTPLTLMIEPLRRILQKTKEPEVLENARLAESNSQKLLNLVNQLLNMAKLENGQMALDLRRGDLGQTVREVFERFLPLAERHGVKLTVQGGTSANFEKWSNLEFDAGKVELVLNNLISNALKFTPEGGRVEIVCQDAVSVPFSGRRSGVQISVRDTGIGIPAEALSRVFDRFYQVDGSHTRTREGTGIGLALSKELAELMGGHLLVESEVGRGSTFTLFLAMNQDDWKNQEAESRTASAAADVLENSSHLVGPRPKHGGEAGEKPVVLVIEDNAELRHFIKKSVADAGWQVAEASDGSEGVQRALSLVPDVVISDVMMPGKDGFSVVDELKNTELTAHIPVILLTAKTGIESKLKGLQRGADDYLTKPFNTEELLVRMGNLVETRRRLRAIFGKQLAQVAATSGLEKTGEPAGEEFLSAPDRDFLQRFMLLLEKHLSDEKLGVEDFSKKLYISRVQLHRKLKALTDRSATDFIRDYRLERAHAMLRNREGRVGEISLRVGFGNEKYFSTVFKEKFGVSPSQL